VPIRIACTTDGKLGCRQSSTTLAERSVQQHVYQQNTEDGHQGGHRVHARIPEAALVGQPPQMGPARVGWHRIPGLEEGRSVHPGRGGVQPHGLDGLCRDGQHGGHDLGLKLTRRQHSGLQHGVQPEPRDRGLPNIRPLAVAQRHSKRLHHH